MTFNEYELGDLITLKRGYDLPNHARHHGDIPVVSSAGISGFHADSKVKGPGVVTGRYGTIGEVHYIIKDFWPLNTTLYVQNFKGNYPRFIAYLLKTLNLASHNAAAAVPGVNRNDLHRLKVFCPPLPIQHRIASILSAYDDLIENNTRRIAILEEMARRIYEEWFVHFRFPGHEKVKMVDSELGKIPEGWEIQVLGDLVNDIRQSIQPNMVDPETPYVGLEHIPRRSIALSEWGKATDVQSTKIIFQERDILFGKIRPYFHKVAVAPIGGVTSSDSIVIRTPNEGFYPIVLATVSSDAFVAHATQTSNGTKMPRANWNVLTQYPIAIPPNPLLGRFNSFINNMVIAVKNFTMKNRNLRTTRDFLLPKLISGEIDVSKLPEPEEAAA